MSVVGAEAGIATSITQQIVERIAAEEGVRETDLDLPLYSVVDPDALETLFAQSSAAETGRNLQVQFTYSGYRVTVTGDEDVQVTPITDERDS